MFFRLTELTGGDEIVVHHADDTITTFVIERLEQHDKDAFPTGRVYGGTEEFALRLVTCGGSFNSDRRTYRDNVIVFASAG